MPEQTPLADPRGEHDDLPADLRPVERRLTGDAARWQTRLPATDRLDAHARSLPRSAAGARTSHRMRTRFVDPKEPEMEIPTRTSPRTGRMHSWLGVGAAAVVVGLLGALLLGIHGHLNGPTDPTLAALGRTAGPGPDVGYIVSAVTARGVDGQQLAVGPTTRFTAGQTVYVAYKVRGAPRGPQYYLPVRWFLDGKLISVTGGPDNYGWTA